jgi:hypothetical protein
MAPAEAHVKCRHVAQYALNATANAMLLVAREVGEG